MNLFFYLVLHIIGVSTMAGAALVDFFCYTQFWKQYPRDKARAAAILPVLANFRFLFAGGFILLLISGVGMVALSHGAFAEQRWFRVKMGILVLVILNGAVIGGRTARSLRKKVEEELAGTGRGQGTALAGVGQGALALKGRLRVIHLFQLLLFITIFTLSVYKFN
ncbi:MAG TPA: hypothetical protein VHD83_25530 [Puia sp.]|nr:hypothetical protein [Puia sp.]